MSRRASVFARQNPGRRRVRFPDEVMFEESIKESDGDAIMSMLRRASVNIDVDRINMAGMTALHQAILDENLVVVRLLIHHGAEVNKEDEDSWTPLHAAAANGLHQIAAFLLSKGAIRGLKTDEGETALDLVDPEDTKMAELLSQENPCVNLENLQQVDHHYSERRMSGLSLHRTTPEPAWFRRESLVGESDRRSSLLRPSPLAAGSGKVSHQRQTSSVLKLPKPDNDPFSVLRARKGSMWVGGEGSRLVEEEGENHGSDNKMDITETVIKKKKVFEDMEEEENVAEKLEKWKRRRVTRLVDR